MTKFVNNLKTTMLLAAMIALVLVIGWQFGRTGLIVASIFGGLMPIVTYFFSDKIALATMGGREVDEKTAPDLYEMIRRLSHNAGLPMPRVYICPQEAPNAFATGRNPKHAAVAVTQGALRLLTYDELEGVMSHELAHVKNRDTLTSCVAAAIAGAISALAHMAWWFGGMGRDRDNPLGIVGLLLTMLLAPFAAALIQMAISRSREYVADADGAHIAGTPHGLIGALQKLDAVNHRVPLHNGSLDAQNHMFIVQPLSGKSFARLFSTHPPMEERIKRLRELAR